MGSFLVLVFFALSSAFATRSPFVRLPLPGVGVDPSASVSISCFPNVGAALRRGLPLSVSAPLSAFSFSGLRVGAGFLLKALRLKFFLLPRLYEYTHLVA